MSMGGLIVVRRVDERDSDDLLAWRNDEKTRQSSKNTAEVPLADHLRWFAASLSNPDRLMFVGLLDENKIGTVRFDRKPNTTNSFTASVTVNPAFRGQGHGKQLLGAAIEEIAPCALEAEIRDGNEASRKIFEACGFRCVGPAADKGYSLFRAVIS
jgi:RimJ/RimL family protein N-acetyltransferase